MTSWQAAPVLAAIEAMERPGYSPTTRRLIADVSAGLRVLQAYGVEITEEQIMERTRCIVAGLLGNYTITGTGE